MTIPDTATNVATDRDPAHYSGRVNDDDDLTAAQRAAIEDLRAKVEAVADAERARLAAINARTRAVQAHEETLRAMGWRRVARVVGGVTESTLRGDSRTRIEEES